MLIVSRAISGIGGSAILSMVKFYPYNFDTNLVPLHHTDSTNFFFDHSFVQVFVIISELVPLEQRGKYQGYVTCYSL